MNLKLNYIFPKNLIKICFMISIFLVLTACNSSSEVMAQQNNFLDLNLEFIGEYQLEKQFDNTTVGGLSGLTYDAKNNLFYAISDDRSNINPARFYTLAIDLDNNKIQDIKIKKVTFLKNESGQNYDPGTIDAEGIAVSPRNTVFISSEGSPNSNIPPFVGEFDLETGQLKQYLRIPQRYLPGTKESPQGVQENFGFEALSLNPNSLSPDDPFRLFTATESALIQDNNLVDDPESEARNRWMHYVVNPFGDPILVAEHLYLLDPPADDVLYNGLSAMMTLEKEGYFLTLERTYGLFGAGAKIFQVINANATDTSQIASLKGDISNIIPLKKQLVLDLNSLGIELDNLEGITFGPRLPDGSRSLLLVSDDNFNDSQINQFLLFRLIEK
jgi:hypothetical protein